MTVYLVSTVAGAAAGAIMTGLLLWHFCHHEPVEPFTEPIDPWVEAEIDQAAAAWATEHGRPEAAGLLADKLRLLHRLGSERRQS
jgi:hypothetical protein